MRFEIEVRICVQAKDFEHADKLVLRAEEAVAEAVGDAWINSPEDGSESGSTLRGLDAESSLALKMGEGPA